MVDTPHMAAREPLIWLFESNRKRFATLVTCNNKQKQKSRTYMQRETLPSSNIINQLRAFDLEFFDQILEIFMNKNDSNGKILRVIMIQMGQGGCNFACEWRLLIFQAYTTIAIPKICLPDLDPTFAKETRLTFTVVYQFISKYLDSISFQANEAFNNFAEKSNNCIWRKFLDKYICPDFWDTLVRFLTKIAHQVYPFTIKEIIEFSSNVEDSNSIDASSSSSIKYFLAQSLYEPYMFEHVPKPYMKFVDDDIELVINNINDDLNLISDQDSKSCRRAMIMELGYLLTRKIIGLDFNIEDITFTSSLKLVDEISDKENEHPSNLYTEDDETNPATDHNESDDEGIYKYLSATREGPRGSSTQKFSSRIPRKISLMQRKR
ncbi:7611_t:CDS:2 [Cetraspora pellucida]|uniref:7611_t:CDS:1 n=1 Tax=Cetraspora pellucida TaxID=1433469 RepID=A0A9N9N6T2_9GLOM|nr:7611_t:CDS:2 [Cetraspora pellucida]